MRLLNTTTLQLQEFFENRVPKYAILSHRWGQNEVSYKEYRKGKNLDGAGYEKILRFCAFARSQGWDWVWMDACCIDKRSSAELSESINSMWRWYEKSEVCYAYLSDVSVSSNSNGELPEQFSTSEWFRRGWTLQELLAPHRVIFLSNTWSAIGSRRDLARDISRITRIPQQQLEMQGWRSSRYCVAQKMSWASTRRTTRPEDQAYCLLGLFDIHMPLLYGEGGTNAFRRLQVAIIEKSDDETIFAWTSAEVPVVSTGSYGQHAYVPIPMLAALPSWFANGTALERRQGFSRRAPYTMTNKGVMMHVRVRRLIQFPHEMSGWIGQPRDVCIIALNSYYREAGKLIHCKLLLNGSTMPYCSRLNFFPADLRMLEESSEWEEVSENADQNGFVRLYIQ